MKSPTNNIKSKETYQFSAIIFCCSLITLIFNSKIQDPFNAPKFWLLLLAASWTLGIVFVYRFFTNSRYLVSFKVFRYTILIFVVASFVSALLSDDLYTSFIGENMRRTGFLTYLCLVIIFLYFSRVTNQFNVIHLVRVAVFTGLAQAIYGFMQFTNNDFVKWSNPYNKIITTLGNPNFAAASLSILAVISFGAVLFLNLTKFLKVLAIVNTFLSLVTIVLSEARQGLVTFIFGVGFLIISLLFLKSKKLFIVGAGFFSILLLFSILALAQIGPLTNLIYKGSISIRGYYWRAGIEMFKNNFFFGVGLDSYQKYFKVYRSPSYSLNYGYEITSSNAHNVPIQLLATGGVFVGFAYIFITLLIFSIAIKRIFIEKTENQKLLIPIFSGWLVYQAQSFVSIDSLGLSIWGWLLGGAVLGLSGYSTASKIDVNSSVRRGTDLRSKQIIISSILISLPSIAVYNFHAAESQMLQARVFYNPNDVTKKDSFYMSSKSVINNPFTEPYYKYQVATFLITNGFDAEGFKLLNEMIVKEPTNLDYLNSRAGFYEQLGKYQLAIIDRKSIESMDPWNARNYLIMGLDYKYLGDLANMKQSLDKILKFNTVDDVYKEALKVLVE